ncbi:hypothetical protein [Caballeronia terrestris]|uniref:hypothetical protein n=1 Tax=Caballeronia terrestris TaxID=1226301 RepID=UPI000F7405DC|nr:hypothetical protein [Caballeronia terrestris]
MPASRTVDGDGVVDSDVLLTVEHNGRSTGIVSDTNTGFGIAAKVGDYCIGENDALTHVPHFRRGTGPEPKWMAFRRFIKKSSRLSISMWSACIALRPDFFRSSAESMQAYFSTAFPQDLWRIGLTRPNRIVAQEIMKDEAAVFFGGPE